jgi:hypothetical protein
MEEVGLDVAGGAPEPIEETLTEDQVADLLCVPQRVLARMRRKGEGPAYVMCGKFIRYPTQAVRRFLASAGSSVPA